MKYYLVFHIDKLGNNGIVLRTSDDLQEMDEYIINNFQNAKDVLKRYENDIAEFCLDNRKKIISENVRNNHNRLGAITLFGEYVNVYGQHIFKIPIIYQNNNRLVSTANCIKIIKEKLNNNQVINILLNDKKYLLSHNEINLINLYFKFNDENIKKEFIETFINQIKKLSDSKKYFFFRSLMNVCSLNKREFKSKVGTVKNVSSIKKNMKLQKEEHSYLLKNDELDEYLVYLIETNNYEEMNKYFDINEIDKTKRLINN